MGQARVTLWAAATLLTAFSCAAGAETSSWQQRISPSAPAPKADSKPAAKVQSRKVEPSQAPKGPLGAASSAKLVKPVLGPATATAPTTGQGGADAAYEAFDQGRYLTALTLATKQAEERDPQAHTLVARIHAEGLGVPQDQKLAAQWYQRGMELGDVEAMLGLGLMHARGLGVAQDYAKAAELMEKAAATGHAEAVYNLALLFLAGKGKAENPQRGFRLMQYAAEKGVMAAMYDLGTLYATGAGTEANAFEAAKWIGKAANEGHPEAELDYAVILLKDHDVPAEQKAKLRARAVELLRSAGTKGIVAAQNRLAHCYLGGVGVTKDLVEAAKWHLVAKAGGVDDEVLEKAAGGLNRADRQKAALAAAEWREQTFLE